MKQKNESQLEFIDGKFIKDGVVVPISFGDTKQIELLNNLNDIKEVIKNGDYDLPCWEQVDDELPYFIVFRCVCGRRKEIGPKPIITEFTHTHEMKLQYTCECGQKWKGESDEGFFFNFRKTK